MSTAPTPEELFEHYRRGDWDALDSLYEHFERTLYRFAVRMLGSQEDGEDALQETWCRVHQHRASWHSGSSVRSWLFCILRNVCFDVLRRRRETVHFEDESDADAPPGPSGESALTEWYRGWGTTAFDPYFRRAVEALLQQLSPMYRVLILYAFEGLSYAEMAEQEAIPESKVRGRLHRAREQLKDHLTRQGYRPDYGVAERKRAEG